ncbi:MAG: ethanolamine utilization protein EutJ [Lachnospiraceae bacterium]|nr:ethanolamine utilization protein EutJ [Lachnospiraceae bacterium]
MIIENEALNEFHRLVKSGKVNPYEGTLKCGVDLGTANIVLAVTDENNHPVAGSTFASSVVRDGIVVDYMGAIRIVRDMKAALEEKLGTTLTYGSCAIPPGILEGNVKAIANVVESAGFEVTAVVDEPTAAASVLGIMDGGVVDVGGGTTGISILKDGKVVFVADEPTGGTHMSLVLAGYFKVPFEEAEEIKKDTEREKEVFGIIRPVATKMATIVKRFMEGQDVPVIYVVGGASCFQDFESVFELVTEVPVYKANHPLLVTPLGIAYHCETPATKARREREEQERAAAQEKAQAEEKQKAPAAKSTKKKETSSGKKSSGSSKTGKKA